MPSDQSRLGGICSGMVAGLTFILLGTSKIECLLSENKDFTPLELNPFPDRIKVGLFQTAGETRMLGNSLWKTLSVLGLKVFMMIRIRPLMLLILFHRILS